MAIATAEAKLPKYREIRISITVYLHDRFFQPNDWVRAIIKDISFEKGRVLLSTKDLESEPGEMLKDPISVYNNAA